jgi:hypothetical protein
MPRPNRMRGSRTSRPRALRHLGRPVRRRKSCTTTTVRTAWAKARKISAHGDEVILPDDHPLSEVSWLRAGLDRAKQTPPNGYCGMPAHSPSEHANPSLTCPLFLTTPEFLPEHQPQHRITLSLVETARHDDHHRVVEKNEQVAANLERIITACQSCQPAQIVARRRQDRHPRSR